MNSVYGGITLLLLAAAVLLAAGCTGQQKPDSPVAIPPGPQLTGIPKTPPPFESIVLDARTYNVGEVVEFYVVDANPGKGGCTDHPCSYRIARLVKNESWQVMRLPIVTMLPFDDVAYYDESCQPMHFATTGWIPGRYRIQYRCGLSAEFVVREVPEAGVP
ncbi:MULTISPECIES: hypothetical protein [unclassified Methanoregula]|uniref:hypothetical protein n=1 Tax=unclassified Methanoregula TaxID=2649730 RepID=UPI0025D0180A|nr:MULTISPECIES: hypothetical protein [unclassified Methanoregula]